MPVNVKNLEIYANKNHIKSLAVITQEEYILYCFVVFVTEEIKGKHAG